jgi:hypothetical protein
MKNADSRKDIWRRISHLMTAIKKADSRQDIWHPNIWPHDDNENSQSEARNMVSAHDGNKNDQFEARNLDFSYWGCTGISAIFWGVLLL